METKKIKTKKIKTKEITGEFRTKDKQYHSHKFKYSTKN